MTSEELAAVEAQLFKGWCTARRVYEALDEVRNRILALTPHQTPHGHSRKAWLLMVHDLLNYELKQDRKESPLSPYTPGDYVEWTQTGDMGTYHGEAILNGARLAEFESLSAGRIWVPFGQIKPGPREEDLPTIEAMAGAFPDLVSDPDADPDTIAVPKAVYAEVLARLAYLTEFVIFSGDLHDALIRDHERLKMCGTAAGEAPKGTEEEGEATA
jgi:hypothetical protein